MHKRCPLYRSRFQIQSCPVTVSFFTNVNLECNLMRKILFCISFLCLVTGVKAQPGKTDSLIQLLQQQVANDTTRLRLLCELSYQLYFSDAQKGLLYADTAIALSKKFPGLSYAGQAYRAKGINHWAMSDFGLSLRSYDTALNIFQRLNDTAGIANTWSSLGITFKSMGDAPKALEYHFQALKLFEQLNNSRRMADVMMNIALVYNSLSEYNKALDYFNKASEAAKGYTDDVFNANLWSNIASTYDYMNKTEEALTYYNKAGELYEKNGNKSGLSNNLFNIGIVYLYTDQLKLALPYLKKAAELYIQTGDKNNYSLLCYEMANIYSQADASLLGSEGIAVSKRQQVVLEYLNKGLELARAAGSLDRRADGLMMLSSYYEDNKQFAKALEVYKNYQQVKDSIYQKTKKQAINKQELLYEFDKKEALTRAAHEKQQAIAKAEIIQQQTIRNSVIAGTLLLVVTGALLFFSYKKRRDAKEKQQEAEFNAQVTDTEMKALRSQMNPHFIFNSLNSISDYLDKNETGTASVYISKFARLMRMILENSEQKTVPLENDLNALELYMQLEALRLNNKFSYEVRVEDGIDVENTLVPPLILQPFVENSIWHGIVRKEGAGRIIIRVKKEDAMIACIVEDNGIGWKESAGTTGSKRTGEKQSLGMKITKARIDIINKIKKSNASVHLTDLAEGVKVEIKLPLELAF